MTIIADYLSICEQAARAGGQVLQQWVDRFSVREKGWGDLVTEADFEAQKTIREIIRGTFPEHAMLAEAQDAASDPSTSAEFRWLVDPLDGTMNYVHGVPHYATSVALEHRGELLVGVVFDPCLDECFTAAAGHGAHLNGKPIRTSEVTEPDDALAAVGFPPGMAENAPDLLVFLEVVTRCQGIRRTGSAALNLCYVAAGRFDFYWSFATKIWDVAAGVLMVREAGGEVTAPDGRPFDLDSAQFLTAANRRLHTRVQPMVDAGIGRR